MLKRKYFLALSRARNLDLSNFQKYALIFLMVDLHFMVRNLVESSLKIYK